MPEIETPIHGQIEQIVDDAIAAFGKGRRPHDFAESLASGEFQARVVQLVGQSGKSRYDIDKLIEAAYARKGGGEQLRNEAEQNSGKVRVLDLSGEKDNYSLMQIPGSDTISIDSSRYGWLGVIGINSRTNQAWGYPRQGTGLDTNSWSQLMQEATGLFRQFGGVEKFLELEFTAISDETQGQSDRDQEVKNLLD